MSAPTGGRRDTALIVAIIVGLIIGMLIKKVRIESWLDWFWG